MHQLNKSNNFSYFFCYIIFIALPKTLDYRREFPIFQVRTRAHEVPDFWVSGGSEFHTVC